MGAAASRTTAHRDLSLGCCEPGPSSPSPSNPRRQVPQVPLVIPMRQDLNEPPRRPPTVPGNWMPMLCSLFPSRKLSTPGSCPMWGVTALTWGGAVPQSDVAPLSLPMCFFSISAVHALRACFSLTSSSGIFTMVACLWTLLIGLLVRNGVRNNLCHEFDL